MNGVSPGIDARPLSQWRVMLFDPGMIECVVDTARLFACLVECSCGIGSVSEVACTHEASYALLSCRILSSVVLSWPTIE